jgi:uncharacterized protein YecE (DUF72 family)
MALHVGTSGWSYPEWKPAFYPQGMPAARFLAHYAERLTGCEINATFYRLQSESTVARWAQGTPPGFRFACKAHRALTHGPRLPSAPGEEEFLERFLESLAPLGDRLGALLVQLPPRRERDDAALAGLLSCLPRTIPFALEFRHPSWDHPGVARRVAESGGTVCLADTTGAVPERLPDGPLAYVRLRADHYDDAARDGWRDLLRSEAGARPVFAFAKHEGAPAGDPHVGVGLAEWLVRG